MPEFEGGFNTLYLEQSQAKAELSFPAITKGYSEKLPTP